MDFPSLIHFAGGAFMAVLVGYQMFNAARLQSLFIQATVVFMVIGMGVASYTGVGLEEIDIVLRSTAPGAVVGALIGSLPGQLAARRARDRNERIKAAARLEQRLTHDY